MSESANAPDPTALGASMASTMPEVTGAGPSAGAAPTPAPAAPALAAAPASPEVDAKGRPFDPAKFLPRKDRRGLWIPKSPGRFGRNGEKRPQPGQAPSPHPTSRQSELFGAASPSSPASAGASPSSGVSGGGAAGSYIPPEEPEPTPGAAEADAQAAEPEPEMGADDVAEVGCWLLYGVTGFWTGAPEEAEPPAKEHTRLRAVFAAYLKSKGIETRGFVAVALAFLGYGLRVFSKPKSREWAHARFGAGRRKTEPRPVTPEPPPADARASAPPPPPPARPSPVPPPSTPARAPAAFVLDLPRN